MSHLKNPGDLAKISNPREWKFSHFKNLQSGDKKLPGFLTSLGKGWTNVYPNFQNGSNEIISHRLRVFLV